MKEFLWRLVAFIVTRPMVRRWIIKRAMRTPYAHIIGEDGSRYMERYWIANPYSKGRRSHCREVGYTGRLTPGSYHRISCVPWDGV